MDATQINSVKEKPICRLQALIFSFFFFDG